MTPSDYLLDGIIRDLAGLRAYDERQIEIALVLMKTSETVSLTVTTTSSVEAVSETFTINFTDESLGLRFLKTAGKSLQLERGENVTLPVAEQILNQLLEATKEE